MDKRMVAFIRALRASGVRISIAETQDAASSAEKVGLYNMDYFRLAMRSAMVKERGDQDLYDEFFPLFFSSNDAPMVNITDQLSPEQQEMLQQALEELLGDMQKLQGLMQKLMDGEQFSQEELDQMARMTGMRNGEAMYQRPWFERRLERQSGLSQLEQRLEDLMDLLASMGMDSETLQQLEEQLKQNMGSLEDQISKYVGSQIAENLAQQEPSQQEPDLIDTPFQLLTRDDIDKIRDEVRRLASRLRTRASMRQRKSKLGNFDPRKTIRRNMKYGGIPIEISFKNKHQKPSLILICDVSTSVRYCAELLLTLIYELQDLVRRTNSYVFISDIVDISMIFQEYEPQEAVKRVLADNPPGYYSTDLGHALYHFEKEHMHNVDSRTSVIILGDGRNNYNDPQIGIIQEIRRKAKRLIWFCPERRVQWGSGDSDMIVYAQNADGVYYVNTLRDLGNAVDDILADNL